MRRTNLTEFLRFTERAWNISAAAASRRYTLTTVLTRLFVAYLTGALIWVISPAAAAAITVTLVAIILWRLTVLAVWAKHFAKEYLGQLSIEQKAKAAAAWAGLSTIRARQGFDFACLAIGASVPGALHFVIEGVSSPAHVLDWVVIGAGWVLIGLSVIARLNVPVYPLLARLEPRP